MANEDEKRDDRIAKIVRISALSLFGFVLITFLILYFVLWRGNIIS